jgi:hypothetical protein
MLLVNSTRAANLEDFMQDAFILTNSFLHRRQKSTAEIPIANLPQLNHSSSPQPSDPEEKIRKQSSALTAAFKDPKT